MPTVITKKSTVAAKVPLSTDLQVGELAVNTADKKLYSKHSDNSVVEIGFNPAVPGPIGGTTPSTVNATDITAVNAVVSGGTRTIGGSTLVINETLNNAAVAFPGALVINQTHTASAAGALIADFKTDNSSKFYIRKDGNATQAGPTFTMGGTGATSVTIYNNGVNANNGMTLFSCSFGTAWGIGSGGNHKNIEAQHASSAIVGKSNWTASGSPLLILGGPGTGPSGNQNGGPLNIAGGTPLNSGIAGTLNLAYNGSIAQGFVKCWGPTTLTSLAIALSAKTSDYTLTANDGTITADSTSTAITLTLPTAVGHTRIHAFVKTAGANAVTIDGNASETIDGSLSVTLTDRTVIQSNGTNWVRIA